MKLIRTNGSDGQNSSALPEALNPLIGRRKFLAAAGFGGLGAGLAALAGPSLVKDVDAQGSGQPQAPKLEQHKTICTNCAVGCGLIGEVQNATSHRYSAGLSRDDYIMMSGGATNQADEDRIYVVRANGSVVAQAGGAWFSRAGAEIEPGDTVVVPLDAGKMRPLPLWAAVTTIIYNLAVAVAAVNSF